MTGTVTMECKENVCRSCYRDILDAMLSHVALLDEQGKIIFANKAWKKFAQENGVPPEEVSEGVNYLEVCNNAQGNFSEESVPFANGIKRVLNGDLDSYTIEYPCFSPEKERWFLGRVTPFSDEHYSYALVCHENITARKLSEKRSQDALNHLWTIYENIPIFMLLVDPERRVQEIDEAVISLSGQSRSKMIGAKGGEVLQCIHAFDDPQGCGYGSICQNCNIRLTVLNTFADGKARRNIESRIESQQGEKFFLVDTSYLELSDHPRVLICLRDITCQKNKEKELEKAKEKAEVANRSKSKFLSTMSHEIRTPINGIMGIMELMKCTDLNQKQEKYIDMALSCTERLNKLLTDVLDLSKMEANKTELKEEMFSPASNIQSIRDIYDQLTKQKGNHLKISVDNNIPEKLIGDDSRLSQILINVVGNANKYTENGEINVDALFLPQISPEKCRILFTISDNGQGIPEDKIGEVFESFTQGNNSSSSYTRQSDGVGIGLPLIKKILQLMNGNASITSQQGEGTTVYISIPFKIPEYLRERSDHSRNIETITSDKDLKLLLAEDDMASRLSIERYLERQGVKITTTIDGKKALEELKKNEYDCILVDIAMPKLDGIELTKIIRKKGGKLGNIPVIALTACTMGEDKQKCLQAGMNDYLPKPVELKNIPEIIKKHL